MVRKQDCVIWIQIVLLYIYKKKNIYKDNAEDLEIRLDTSNYELDRPLPKT